MWYNNYWHRKRGIDNLQYKEKVKNYYQNYIKSEQKGFEITLSLIEEIVNNLKQRNIISLDTHMYGRIKSFESAYANIGKKAVDDCFGVRIIASNEDLKNIKNNIEEKFIIEKNKKHNSIEYNALHQMAYINMKNINNDYKKYIYPLTEIQYWNNELEEKLINGELSYYNYKKDLYYKILDNYYNENNLKDFLPMYYEVKNNNIIPLAEKESLFKLLSNIEVIS